MNILLKSNQTARNHFIKNNDNQDDNGRLGERFAAALLTIYTSAALIISAWSGVIILSEDIECGGPIEIFVRVLQATGVV